MAHLASINLEPISIKTSSEALIEAKFIGHKIHSLRVKISMGLIERRRRAGLSASFLSQLETGLSRPLETWRVFRSYSAKDLSYFSREQRQNFFRISRAKERTSISVKEKSVPLFVAESLGALIPDRSVAPDVTDFLPRSDDAGLDPRHFQGIECVTHSWLLDYFHQRRK
jgi:hypothetical protein